MICCLNGNQHDFDWAVGCNVTSTTIFELMATPPTSLNNVTFDPGWSLDVRTAAIQVMLYRVGGSIEFVNAKHCYCYSR